MTSHLQDKLGKEEAATKVNMVKLQNQWRAIMRKSTYLIIITFARALSSFSV